MRVYEKAGKPELAAQKKLNVKIINNKNVQHAPQKRGKSRNL